MQHEFAERAQDQENEDAADREDYTECRARRCESPTCAEEKAGPNGAAEGDHLDLPVRQSFVIARVFAGKSRGGVFRRWHQTPAVMASWNATTRAHPRNGLDIRLAHDSQPCGCSTTGNKR